MFGNEHLMMKSLFLSFSRSVKESVSIRPLWMSVTSLKRLVL